MEIIDCVWIAARRRDSIDVAKEFYFDQATAGSLDAPQYMPAGSLVYVESETPFACTSYEARP